MDWVYRGTEADPEGSLDTSVPGSYGAGFFTISSGQNMAQVLVDSQNYLSNARGGDLPFFLGEESRPTSRRMYCGFVQGWMEWQATTWAAGNDVRIGFRIGKVEQDPDTGLLEYDAQYNMWVAGGGLKIQPSVWANDDLTNRWERRVCYHFATGNETSLRTMAVGARVNCWLASHEALVLYIETAQSSVGVRFQSFLRTRVSGDASG